MDSVFLALNVLSLVSVIAYGFVLYQLFRLAYTYFAYWFDDLQERRPLLLRLPPRAVSALLALCFVAVVL